MSKMTIIPKPYAGLAGSGNTVQMRDLEDRLIIRLASGQYFFMIFILVAFGSLLSFIALYGFPARRAAWVYHGMQYGCWAFAALLCWILIRYLRGMPRIEISKASGEMQFFKYRAGEPEFIVGRPEVQRFDVRVEPYFSGRVNYPQYVLYLEKKDGASVPLCGSVDEKVISNIHGKLEKVVGITNLSGASWSKGRA